MREKQTVDLSQRTIQRLFYEQMKALTIGERQSLDFQFSERWLK